MTVLSPRRVRTLLAAVLLGIGSAALAQQNAPATFTRPEEALAYRQSAFRLLEFHFSRLNASSLGRLPADPRRDQLDARMVALLMRLPFSAFVPGTDTAQLPGSRAKPLVWSAAPRFHESTAAAQARADALPGAVQAGDIGALRKLLLDTGAVCRKCHEQFRVR